MNVEVSEADLRTLADAAVIAIAKVDETLAPAVRAVKDEMHVPRAMDQKPKGRTA